MIQRNYIKIDDITRGDMICPKCASKVVYKKGNKYTCKSCGLSEVINNETNSRS